MLVSAKRRKERVVKSLGRDLDPRPTAYQAVAIASLCYRGAPNPRYFRITTTYSYSPLMEFKRIIDAVVTRTMLM
jgi:hypothetical protein